MIPHPQNTPEWARLAALIEGTPVAMMATLDDAGALTSRPMTPLAMDASGALWFFTDLQSDKLAQLQAVNLSFADAGRSSYVSLSGQGSIDTDATRIRALWTPLAKAWFPAGPESPDLALLKFVPRSGEFWDAASSRMVRLLAMAASMVSGKPVAMGDHERYPDLFDSADAQQRKREPGPAPGA
jgi:general stress protein 26